MKSPKLEIIRAAPAIHFQDLGRFGHGHQGFSQGGPLDLHAHCWANYLLGNSSDYTTLEICYGNTVFLALEDTCISLTGAEMRATVDGDVYKNWSSHFLRKGSILKLNYASKGTYAYLGIRGGFLAPEVLGSSATVMRNSIGKLLKDGEKLSVKNASDRMKKFILKSTPSRFRSEYLDQKIRVILPAGQDREFREKLLSTTYEISPKTDRMGMNLIAETPLPAQSGIISEGASLGTLQLLPDGNVIVLLNDRQSQGGYAKIANIARVDLPILIQSRPGTKIILEAISMRQATEEWRKFAEFFKLLSH